MTKPLRVLLAAPSYYGYDVAIARALEQNGCRVQLCSYFGERPAWHKARNLLVQEVLPAVKCTKPAEGMRQRFNRRVYSAFQRMAPDVTLVVKGDVLDPDLIDALGRKSRVVYWAYDDPYRYSRVVEALRAVRTGLLVLAARHRPPER